MLRNKSTATLRRKLLILSIGTTLAATMSLCVYGFVSLRDALRSAAVDQLSADMALYEEKVKGAFEGLVSDATFLASTPDVVDAMKILTREVEANPQFSFQARATRQRLERTITSFLGARPYLTRVRLIERSPSAPELVRVDSSDGQFFVVPPEQLEKRGRDAYMMASATLWPGDWHFSGVAEDEGAGVAGATMLTFRIILAVPGINGETGGFVVLDADFRTLMQYAVGSVPEHTGIDIVMVSGGRLTFSPDAPLGAFDRVETASATRRPDSDSARAGQTGEADKHVEVSRRMSVGGGESLTLMLRKAEAALMSGANTRLFEFVKLSMLLVMLASVTAVFLGNRLAAHLATLAAQVSRPRPESARISLRADGFREVKVLAKAFEDVFNRLADQSSELVWRASHDQLSGLLNRRGMDDAIRSRLSSEEPVAVIQLDLDRFKLVNDTLGHEAGDAVIAEVGHRLRALCRVGDIMCRIGGDEFVVIRVGADRDALEEFAREALPMLAAPLQFRDRVCRFGTSMGAADGPVDLLRSGELFRRADHALYRAKSEGRGRFCYFGPEMERRLRDRAMMAADLETALENDEFVVEYMPKVLASDRTIVGLEALVRWQHPTRGMLMPNAFLPIAEELKLTEAIDEHVLRTVLAHRSDWLSATHDIPPISVNVSARRLLDPGLVDSVRSLEIPHGAISFELLESIFLDNASEFVAWSCDSLREMGIGIEIDDFGSGHASILGITRIKPDHIKIDQALVQQIEDRKSNTTMVRAILEMAAAFGIATVAEGVESEVQAQILARLGCMGLQGYHIGRPVAATGVPALVTDLSKVAEFRMQS